MVIEMNRQINRTRDFAEFQSLIGINGNRNFGAFFILTIVSSFNP